MIFAISCCVGGIGFAFYQGPLFAGYSMTYIPIFILILVIFGKQVQKATIDKLNVTKGLGGVAEETLNAIKVVASFGQEEKEVKKFEEWAKQAHIVGRK